MVLKRDTVKSFARNCLSTVDKENGCIEFLRFTDKQYALYGRNPGFAIRARCTVGVCLDFYYDGSLIDFPFYIMKQASRTQFSFDLYADGVLVYSLFSYNTGEGLNHFNYRFETKKRRRIQLYLPNSVGAEICNFAVDDDAACEPAEPCKKKILALGDSITQGFDTRFTSLCYATAVARSFDAQVLNQSIAGHYFEAAVIDENLPFEPDAVTVAYGTNDWGRHSANEEEYRAEAKAYIDKLCTLYSGVPVFGITPIWRADNDKRPERMKFENIYDILGEYYSAHSNVTIIDGRKIVPNNGAFLADGLHPNTLGHDAYALGVITAMNGKF